MPYPLRTSLVGLAPSAPSIGVPPLARAPSGSFSLEPRSAGECQPWREPGRANPLVPGTVPAGFARPPIFGPLPCLAQQQSLKRAPATLAGVP